MNPFQDAIPCHQFVSNPNLTPEETKALHSNLYIMQNSSDEGALSRARSVLDRLQKKTVGTGVLTDAESLRRVMSEMKEMKREVARLDTAWKSTERALRALEKKLGL